MQARNGFLSKEYGVPTYFEALASMIFLLTHLIRFGRYGTLLYISSSIAISAVLFIDLFMSISNLHEGGYSYSLIFMNYWVGSFFIILCIAIFFVNSITFLIGRRLSNR